MATDSKIFKFSLKRFKTSPRRRESSPRSKDTTPTRKSPSLIRDMDKRYRTKRSRSGGRYRDRTWESRPVKTARRDSSIRRITSYSRYSESNYSGDSPKIIKKENSERRREYSPFPTRPLCRSYYSKAHENRGEQSRRRVARSSRARSGSRDGIRHEECYDDVESHRNFLRIPMTIPENYKCHTRLVIPPPPPIAVPRPGRIHLPARIVPRPPHMRLPFPIRVVRGVAPVLVTPVVIFGPPMMPLRPPVAVTTNRLC